MTVEDRSIVPEVLERLRALSTMSVEVGVLSDTDGELLMIANVHEFGCEIPVTPRMRAFFRYQWGVNLSKSVIKIPERSFIRSSFDTHSHEIYLDGEKLIDDVIEGVLSPQSFFDYLGTLCVQTIQNFIRNEVGPPNSGFTQQKKGSSSPLIDTGRLLGSINYKIRGGY